MFLFILPHFKCTLYSVKNKWKIRYFREYDFQGGDFFTLHARGTAEKRKNCE